jgi:hypothetical protein
MLPLPAAVCRGTTFGRNPAAGASAPWQVTRCLRGGGTSAHRRSIKTSFVITTAVVPSR